MLNQPDIGSVEEQTTHMIAIFIANDGARAAAWMPQLTNWPQLVKEFNEIPTPGSIIRIEDVDGRELWPNPVKM